MRAAEAWCADLCGCRSTTSVKVSRTGGMIALRAHTRRMMCDQQERNDRYSPVRWQRLRGRSAATEVRRHRGARRRTEELFNAIDPSPFRDKDLDPKAEEFIVGWAKDLPRDAPLALMIDLDRPAGLPDEAAVLRDAIHEFFRQRAHAYRRRLRELFRLGRTSLLIGLIALAAATALGDFLGSLMKGSGIGAILRESFTIGGWVSMWRPLEVFLYDWWPIRNEARLSDRLATMPVRIRYINAAAPESWRADWPAVSPPREQNEKEHGTGTLDRAG
jgi:hypothetical protein